MEVTREEYESLLKRVEALENRSPGTVAIVERSPARRGTRLVEGWVPDQVTIEKIKLEFPHLTRDDFAFEHRQFCDYWLAKAGKDAVKLDWGRTWCSWMRRAAQGKPKPRAQTSSAADEKVVSYMDRARRLSGE